MLDPFYTLNGENYFTDKQYARYAEHTGKLASKLFELGKFDAENPDRRASRRDRGQPPRRKRLSKSIQ